MPDHDHFLEPSCGARAEDHPYRPRLQLEDPHAVEKVLRLDHAGPLLTLEARRALLANLLTLPALGWLFYSRDTNCYVGKLRYAPRHFRRAHVVEAVDQLVMACVVEHERTAPSRFARLRSRIRLTAHADNLLQPLKRVGATTRVLGETIVLRAADGQLASYRDTAETYTMREDAVAQNAFLADHIITLHHPDAVIDGLGFVHVADQRLDPTFTSCYRVFNVDF